MRNFELVQNVLSIIVMAIFGVIIGLAMVPSYLLFFELTSITEGKEDWLRQLESVLAWVLVTSFGESSSCICGLMGGLFRIRKEEGDIL